jgi:hypothetical protein
MPKVAFHFLLVSIMEKSFKNQSKCFMLDKAHNLKLHLAHNFPPTLQEWAQDHSSFVRGICMDAKVPSK